MTRDPAAQTPSTPQWQALASERDRLVRLARARGCSPSEAQDLASETLLRAATFPGLDYARLEPFLATVLRRLVVDQRRRDAVHQRTLPSLVDPAHLTSHEDDVCERFDAARTLRHVEQLPSTERAVFRARCEGHSVASVSRQLHLSPKTVEGAYTRARRRLRRTLGVAALLWAWPRTRPVTGSVTALATPVVLAALTLGGAAVPPAPASPFLQERPHVAVVRTVPTRPAPVLAPATQPVRRQVAQPSTPAPRASASKAPVQPLAVSPPRVSSHADDETFQESLERCLRDGQLITPERLGCDPERSLATRAG